MAPNPLSLQISGFQNEKDNAPKLLEATWLELCAEPIVSEKKEGVACWSPATFNGSRSKRNVVSVSCLVFDLDSELTDTLVIRLSKFNYIVHSTFTPGRWRIILQTSRPHSPHEHKTLWKAVARHLGGDAHPFDKACTDESRLYYWATKHPERPFEKYENFEGLSIDVDAMLSRMPLEARPTAPPRAPAIEATGEVDLDTYRAQVKASNIRPDRKELATKLLSGTWGPETGGRDNAIMDAVGGLFTVADPLPPPHVCEFLAEGVLSHMETEPEGRESWRRVLLNMCERNRAHQAAKRAENRAENEAFEKFAQERGDPAEWRKQFQGKPDEHGNVFPKSSGPNVELILRNDSRFAGLRYNTVTREIEATEAPLRGKDANVIDTVLSNWLSTEYKMTVNRGDAFAQLNNVLSERKYDPLKEWLEGLVWDGTPRVEMMLRERCKAVGSDFYVNEISKRWFIACARRGMTPGIQMDNVLILKGKGGVGKTSFVRVLGGEFAAQTTLDLSNKDALHIVSGMWMVELAELSSWRKTEQNHFRGFVTQNEDTFRAPYARVPVKHPRRCVFVGTSNDMEPVEDIDGERRYWAVEVGDVDLAWLKENRTQLWAEAVHLARTDAIHYFTAEEQERIRPEVKMHQKVEPIAEQIETWFMAQPRDKRPTEITVNEMFEHLGFSNSERLNRGLQGQMGQALKSLGFLMRRETGGRRSRYYVTPEEILSGVQKRRGGPTFSAVPKEEEHG